MTRESQHCFSSLPTDLGWNNEEIRRQREIEYQVKRVQDVAFSVDESRMSREHAAANLIAERRLALKLRLRKSTKAGVIAW